MYLNRYCSAMQLKMSFVIVLEICHNQWQYGAIFDSSRQDQTDHVRGRGMTMMQSPENQLAKSRAAVLSIASNSLLILLKLIVGVMMQSVSVISEAVHSGIDLIAAIIAWFSIRESGKPADDNHRFGHGKIENVAGTVEAVLIFGAAFYIIWEAVHKLRAGTAAIESLGWGTAVMAVSAGVNYLVSRHLLSVAIKTDSVALEADALHLRTDVYTSLGVLGGLVAIKLTGIAQLDPIVALVVALMIMKAAWELTKTAFFHVLDVKLPDDEEVKIHDVMERYKGRFIEYHKLRTRKSGHVRHIDMHLVVPKQMTVEAGHTLAHQITGDIEQALAYSQILVHIEPCPAECGPCTVDCLKLAMAALFILCAGCTAPKEKPKAKPAAPVKVAKAVLKDLPVQVKAIGTIEAYTTVAIKSQVNGQIARIHFSEGSDVEQGALLISIDPEPFQAVVSQCEAALAKDQAQARFAHEQAVRYEGLLKDGIVTRDQYELLQANAEALAATVRSDRAAITNAKIQLSYCSIRAPLAGRTGAISLHSGNLVKANDLPIVTINQLAPILVTFSLPEKRLADIKRAMASGQLKIEAVIPNEPGVSEAGTISFVDNAVNPATGTIKLKGVFANKARRLWPGQFTDLLLTMGNRANAVVVPTNAVMTGQQGEFVYVVKQGKKVEPRKVTSAAAGEETVIEKGLAAGETVVIDGQLRLTPGAAVEIKR